MELLQPAPACPAPRRAGSAARRPGRTATSAAGPVLGLALGVALLLPAPAMLAASTAPGPAAPAATPARAQRPPLSDGEIRKIDPDRRRVTLRHGELPHLQMPPMTMSFRVAEPPRLKGLKPGDRVRFVAAMEGDELVVLRIERAR